MPFYIDSKCYDSCFISGSGTHRWGVTGKASRRSVSKPGNLVAEVIMPISRFEISMRVSFILF